MKKETSKNSFLLPFLSNLIERGNNWFTITSWFFKPNRKIFFELEILMLLLTAICIGVLFFIHLFPLWLEVVVGILLIQRPIEFLIVYTRNFIFNRGRIFTDFEDAQRQGEWLILMFMLNIIQITIIFAIWYHLISILDLSSFNQSLGVLDSIYFSVINFLTIGFGDIAPISTWAKSVVLIQNIFSFFTLVIVINGLISIHFVKRR